MATTIYGLKNPICGSDEVRYVGQTTEALRKRLAIHIRDARSGDPSWRSHWIREVLMLGHVPTIETLEVVDDARANAAEREWIRRLGARGRLTNTDHYQSRRVPPVAYVDRLWPDETEGPYYIRVTLSLIEATLAVTALSIGGTVPPCDPPWTGRETGRVVPLRSREVQKIPIQRIAKATLDELTVRWAPLLLKLPPGAGQEAADALLHAPRVPMGRPPLYSPEHWAEVAEVASDGGPKAVMERYNLSYSTAWRWVDTARRLT